MIRKIFLLLLSIILIGCGNEDLLSSVEVKPIINVGKISYNSYKLFDIRVTNIGNKDIMIKKIRTSCGCMNTEKECINSSIVSGESLDIKFKYKPLSSGYVEKDIYLYFYNYKKPLKICVKGFAVE